MSSQKGLKVIQLVSGYLSKTNGFEQSFNKLKLVSAGNGACQAELKLESGHLNGAGGLHGGLTATLVDSVSTYALMTNEADTKPGVSVDMHISYLKGAREGDEIQIDAKIIKSGKTLAFLEVELKKKDTQDIIARGSHTKFIG